MADKKEAHDEPKRQKEQLQEQKERKDGDKARSLAKPIRHATATPGTAATAELSACGIVKCSGAVLI